jgi:hypothetical protein
MRATGLSRHAGLRGLAFCTHPHQHGVVTLDLREEWADVLRRRAEFADTLLLYRNVIEAWAEWRPRRPLALDWSAAHCHARWESEIPLLGEAPPPPVTAAEIENLVGAGLDAVASVRGDRDGDKLRRFARGWDSGTITPDDLTPRKGRLGSEKLETMTSLSPAALGFLVSACMRPVLTAYFADAHSHFSNVDWSAGVCPFCGAPPGFCDVLEDGRRRVACHLCSGTWIASRGRCVYCGTTQARDLVKLEPEQREEGYSISACRRCRAYVKELDRRARWDGRSALVEDWGSPHFDLVAHREGYWRPLTPPLELARRA